MFIDMHMHESTFSKDSFLKLDEMVELAKEGDLEQSALQITMIWD